MKDVRSVQHIVNGIVASQDLVDIAQITEWSKKNLTTILEKMANSPETYIDTFATSTEHFISYKDVNNARTIMVDVSLDEQKSNLEQVLTELQQQLPKLQTQLESMKGKWYFTPKLSIQYDEEEAIPWNPKQLWDYPIPRNVDKWYTYTKDEFTNEKIEELINKLAYIDWEIKDIFTYVSNRTTIGDSAFAKENFTNSQKQVSQYIHDVVDVYKTINYNFLRKEFPTYLLDKKLTPNGPFTKIIWKRIQQKLMSDRDILGTESTNSSLRKEKKKFIFNLPELLDIKKIPLWDKKVIDNPAYQSTLDEIVVLKSVIAQIAHILNEK